VWSHNCNNFSNDFSTFLVGKGVPEYIISLPQTVLDTNLGRILRNTIDDMIVNSRNKNRGVLGIADGAAAVAVPETSKQHAGTVQVPASIEELERVLTSAPCAIIFFTSQTCPPCKTIYPLYDELAAEAAYKGIFIKVDIGSSLDISMKYSVQATPTFITFLNGEQENRWSGTDPSALRGNVKMLLAMAWPPHPHESLRLIALREATTRPILYSKVPPLDKLLSKMGDSAKDPAIVGVKSFIASRNKKGAAEATLPGLDTFTSFLRDAVQRLSPDMMFPIVDLLRVSLADPRFSGYFAEEKDHKTIGPILDYVDKQLDCPYPLRLVALQTACNLFSSPLYIWHILTCKTLKTPIIQLITTSLLDDKHHSVRVAAASLSFNIAATNSRLRIERHRDVLPQEDQVELAASLLQAITVEEDSPEALKGFLLAFGYLVFCAPKDGELVDLLKSMDAQGTILGKSKLFPKEPLIEEIGNELLGNGA
jgi:thiol-disulfide isomerase/thioredoxin